MPATPRSTSRVLLFPIVAAVAALVPPALVGRAASAAPTAGGTITIEAYVDTDANGVRTGVDSAQNAVAASAVCVGDNGTDGVLGTADDVYLAPVSGTTSPSGSAVLTVGGSPCRVTFDATTFPADSFASISGNGNESSVQFVPAGGTALLLLVKPVEYASAITTQFIGTSYDHVVASERTSVVGFPLTLASVPSGSATAPATLGTFDQTGAVYGVAHSALTDTSYFGAYLKRRSSFGPSGPAAIYQRTSAGVLSTFVNLDDYFGADSAGADPHPAATTDWFDDAASRPLVGKVGLGDVDISPDGTTLYTVNLADKRLYAIPTSGALNSTTIRRFSLPTGSDCTADETQPFGLGVRADGTVFVGGVCSAETTPDDPSRLRAYVWQFNGSAFGEVLTSGLVYHPDLYLAWKPWKDTSIEELLLDFGGKVFYRQAMVSDIEFVGDDLLVAIRDRDGDMVPRAGESTANQPWPRGAGDLFVACRSATGWAMESNAGCTSTSGKVWASDGANNNQGFGNGEYFYQDNTGDNSAEGSFGGIALTGDGGVVMTQSDPIYCFTAPSTCGGPAGANPNEAGVHIYDLNTGKLNGAYAVQTSSDFDASNPQLPQWTDGQYFGKASGLGDIEALVAPIEVGNRVWKDTNANGLQDAGEAGIANVTVTLHDGAGVQIASAVTDTEGRYWFSNMPGTSTPSRVRNVFRLTNNTDNFSVRVDPATSSNATALARLSLTSTNAGDDLVDSDATTVAGSARSNFVTPKAGRNNHSLDFGFSPVPTYSLGNRVWSDTNNDGVMNGSETGRDGVRVDLYSADGAGNPTGTALARMTTTNGGYYRFDDLLAGTYVPVVASMNFASSGVLTGYSSAPGVTPSLSAADVDRRDHGSDMPLAAGSVDAGGVAAPPVALGPGLQPNTTDGDADPTNPVGEAPDTRSNRTVDFGFFLGASLEGNVYVDNDDSKTLTAGDSPIVGVTITLVGTTVDGESVTRTTVTDSNGHYAFTGLVPGRYNVYETQPAAYETAAENPGSTGGQAGRNQLFEVDITAGVRSVANNFGERAITELPKTGSSTGVLMLGGLVCLLIGASALGLDRRRHTSR